MKILVYTVSDFKPNAIDCIKLLYDSLKCKNKNFDFLIISNKHPDKECPFDYVIDTDFNSWVGFLKFSSLLPEGYDKYIYLDSDVLFFEKLDDLIKKDCIAEEVVSMGEKFFCYNGSTAQEKEEMKTMVGINSGTYCFSNREFASDIQKLFKEKIINDVVENLLLEQSSFNYYIFKKRKEGKEFKKILVQFHCTIDSYDKNIKIYHFCGFSNEMSSKYIRMKNFYEKNILKFENE